MPDNLCYRRKAGQLLLRRRLAGDRGAAGGSAPLAEANCSPALCIHESTYHPLFVYLRGIDRMALIDSAWFRGRLRRSNRLFEGPTQPRQGQVILNRHVPLIWLEQSAQLPGEWSHVGVAFWRAGGLTRSSTTPPSSIASYRFGLDRNAMYRALASLEVAGLVAVKHKPGRPPRVKILAPEPVS